MRPPRPPRDPQRGNSLVLALTVMAALATLGSLTVVSMQSSIQTSTHDRAQEIAMYAAESGAAVTMDFLRKHFDVSGAFSTFATSWSTYCTANNDPPLVLMSAHIPSSDAPPGDPKNLFGPDQNAWFHIDVLNNRDDQGFKTNTSTCDTDGILIIRSTGHGPQGSLAIIEWEVQRVGFWWSIPGGTVVAPPPAPAPPTMPPVAPSYWLYPPWTDTSTNPPTTTLPYPPPLSSGWDSWINAQWVKPPITDFKQVGMVLRGWHIVSL